MDTYQTLNEVLVNLFRDIMDIEQKAIITEEYKDLTNNDMHVIEAIGTEEPKNMSTIARLLSVTVGTLTIAMNSLVKKGYVIRQRGTVDRREVYKAMIDSVSSELSQDEMEMLVKTLTKLNLWFRSWQDY